ncbi:hypothetical protein BC332_33630 [Capsicum chinense]|nr:hypothetical protein BC332_33630 [Capsicum chinense]
MSTFCEFIKEKLQDNVSKSQLSDKIRTLQKKFMKSVKDGEMMLDDKAKVLEEKWKKLDDAKATLILNHLDFIREHYGLVVDGMRDCCSSSRDSSTCSSFKEEIEEGGSPKPDLSLGAMVECKQEDSKGFRVLTSSPPAL